MRKLTKTVSALLAVVMLMGIVLCAPFTVSAYDIFASGDYDYTILDDGTAEITKYEGYDIEIVIPSELNGCKVTSIGDYAFEWCESLKSITIPDSVTSIGESAFVYCESLTSITIPDSVTSVAASAFNGCTSLISINVDKNNDSYSSLDGVLFDKKYEKIICYPAGKENLIYKIPDSVTNIGDYAFLLCKSLTSITIPDSVTSIGDEAFSYCESLTSITIPNSVKSIGMGVFYSCTSLTSITIPDSVKSIRYAAFSQCESLTSVTIPDSVTSIGEYAFRDCRSLTSITIPDSVTRIGEGVFFNCTSLTGITIPDSVTRISNYAFAGCNDLIIYGYMDSTAQKYANKNNIDFVILEREVTIGDVNGDGSVTVLDATMLQKYLAGLVSFSDEQLALADTNGDGSVTVLDATEIQKYLAGLVTELGKSFKSKNCSAQ